jgi:membrane fusion protein, multidrug efflux system
MMRQRWTKLGLTGSAVVLLTVGIVLYSRSDRNQAPTAAALQPVPVIAATVQQHEVPIVLTGLGTVTALNTATVRSQITGLLTTVDFQEGQSVKKGDLLAQIDPRTYQAQLDQAEATLGRDQNHLDNAQLNLNRIAPLAKEGFAAQEQLAGQQAAVAELQNTIKADQAAIANAKAQLSYTSLVAPFDGVTGIRLIDVGNIIHPTDPNGLVVVTQVQPISAIFTLATTDIQEVQDALAKGPLQVIAFSQDDKTRLDTGRLLLVDNQADPNSGTIRLKAQFPNQQRRLWPGTFVNVRLVVSVRQDGLTVPLDAIQQGPQGQIVFVVGQDHKIALRPVSVRQTFNAEALIESGVSSGETVVVRGQYRLSPGTLVTLADPNDPDAVPNPSTASSGMLP